MRKTGADSAFNGGDATSRYLVDLTADRAGPRPSPVPGGLVELAQRHGLIPLLARHSDDALVRAIYARESSRMRILQDHLGEVLRDLHAAGVRAAVLKGPAIATRYDDPTLRPFSDLDLLVPDSEVDLALEVLRDYPATLNVPEKRPKADKRDVLIRDETGIRFNLDLHWDLFSYSQLRGSADGATDAAWEEAHFEGDSPLGPLWELPSGYRLAFLAAHAVLDHRFRLILFRDFLEITRGEADWSGAEEVAKAWGLRSTSYMALWLARRVLGAYVPDEVLTSIRPRSLPVSFLEWALTRVDLVRFDGHRPHPVNLAAVLLNDSPRERVSLLLRAPSAFPGWRQRVAAEQQAGGPPRTLILASTDRRRGAEVFSERLRAGLTERGWVIEAAALRSHGEEPRVDLEALVGSDLEVRSRFDLSIAAALRRKARVFRPEVVVANGGATLRYAIAARPGRRYGLVYVAIGEPHYWLRSRVSRWLNRFMLRRADHVIAVSDTTRAQLVDLEPSLAGRISTGYTGVPEELFRMSRPLPTGPLHVLMIGSLTEEKGPGQALRAVAGLPQARLRFVGSGPLRNILEEQARRLSASDRVEFAGSVKDVTPHLEWAHVLILTSLSEGLPGAIIEASAAGVPTVAVDVGGVREAIRDGETGFVTRADDEELTQALKDLDADRELLSRLGQAARGHAADLFRLDHVVNRYADVLRSVAK